MSFWVKTKYSKYYFVSNIRMLGIGENEGTYYESSPCYNATQENSMVNSEYYYVMLFLCPPKIDMTFKITIESKSNGGLSRI